ncbi:cysteine desulfurase family protein [Polaribacter sp. Z022]|uniref:cysteine desulfurase family protein n=1 Tax=Polaribacter sp. Z022 TaxID=2927125 RepID=UPI00202258E8|nr:cysteine desulfurase family protein [Polaribacter sp. Z022]MCL7754408.1 cysteine desulfurase [Polaribacter sp. Z022]
MKTIYLDNAATTQIDDEVINVINTSMKNIYGNPSSTHQFGRKAKSAVETARKNIAKHFNVSASEIVFTAGGTEADNLILQNAVSNLNVKRIITSKIEHHAVLHTCNHLQEKFNVIIDYVKVDAFGAVIIEDLERLLKASKAKTLVSLMMINNEIGNLLDINKISDKCIKHNALFHSDTVQAIGHYSLDLKESPIDFIAVSAHKFHGPKGVGFAYFKKGFGIMPMLHGGDQERGARSSTENVHSILGMEKAIQIAISNLENDKNYIEGLKKYLIFGLKKLSKNIKFNGFSSDMQKSSYTILNVRFPFNNAMLLFSLDMAGISVSGGSACQSGSNIGSHVLSEILTDEDADKTSVRFSFSKYNTIQELDLVLDYLKKQKSN